MPPKPQQYSAQARIDDAKVKLARARGHLGLPVDPTYSVPSHVPQVKGDGVPKELKSAFAKKSSSGRSGDGNPYPRGTKENLLWQIGKMRSDAEAAGAKLSDGGNPFSDAMDFGKDVVGRALGTVQKPLDFTAATAELIAGAVDNAVMGENNDVSASKWWDTFAGGHGPEVLMHAAQELPGPDVTVPKQVPIVGGAPAWHTAVGLGLTVAADPLTYLSGGANVPHTVEEAVVGVKDLHTAAEAAGDTALAARYAQDAARLAKTKSVASLSTETMNELAKARAAAAGRDVAEGVNAGGVWGKVPGTGRFAQRAAKIVTAGKWAPETRAVQLIDRDTRLGEALSKISVGAGSGLHKATDALGEPFRLVQRALGGDPRVNTLKQAMASGNPDRIFDAVDSIRSIRYGQGVGKAVELDLSKQAHDLLHEVKGVDGSLLSEAVRGTPAAAAEVERVAPGWLDKAHEFLATARTTGNKAIGYEAINEIENYAPRVLSDDAVKMLQGEAKRISKGAKKGNYEATDLEIKRSYIPGETFLGEELLDPAQAGRSVEDQMQAIAESQGVAKTYEAAGVKPPKGASKSDVIPWFESDLNKSLPRYVEKVAHTTTTRSIEQQLFERGVAKANVYDATKASVKRANKAVNVQRHLDEAFAEEKAAAADLRVASRRKADVEAAGAQAVSRAEAKAHAEQLGAEAVAEHAQMTAEQFAEQAHRTVAEAHETAQASIDAVNATFDEVVSLREAVQTATVDANERSRHLRALQDEQTRLYGKLAGASEASQRRLAEAGRLTDDSNALAELTQELDDVKAELRLEGRPPSTIDHDISVAKANIASSMAQRQAVTQEVQQAFSRNAEVKAQLKLVDEQLDDLKTTGYKGQVESLRAQLTDLRASLRADIGQFEAQKVMWKAQIQQADSVIGTQRAYAQSLNAELAGTSQAWRGLEDQLAAIDELGADVMSRMRDRQAWDFGRAQEAIDSVAGGQPLEVVPWEGDTPTSDLFHGGMNPIDVTQPPAEHVHGVLDSLYGPHLTTERDVAEGYADAVHLASNDERSGGVLSGVRVLVDDPAAVATYVVPNDWQQIDNAEAWTRLGVADGVAKANMRADNLAAAIDAGVLDAERIARAVVGDRSSEAVYQGYKQRWQEVIDAYHEAPQGTPLEDIVTDVFQHTVYDAANKIRFYQDDAAANLLRTSDPGGAEIFASSTEKAAQEQFSVPPFDPGDTGFVRDPRTGHAVIKELADKVGSDPAYAQEIADAFTQSLRDQGFEAIVYDHLSSETGRPYRVVVPLYEEAVKGFEGAVRDYWHLQREASQAINEGVTHFTNELGALGEHVVEATNDVRLASQRAADAHAELQHANTRLGDAIAEGNQAKIDFATTEADMRQQAAAHYQEADDLAAQAKAIAEQGQLDVRAVQEYSLAQVKMLDGERASAEADLARAHKRALKWDEKAAKIDMNAKFEFALRRTLENGYRRFGPNTSAPDWVVDAMTQVSKRLNGPEGLRPLQKAWDGFTNYFKAWSLATPGTQMRNLFGGFWNNFLADIDPGAYGYYMKGRKEFLAGKDTVAAQHFSQIQDAGLQAGGMTAFEVEKRIVEGTHSKNPFNPNFPIPRAMRGAAQHVENYLRGSLAMDTLKAGGTIDHAIERVMKYHFDYEDLSTFERTVVRRVIPFYTWTRKNLPLQIEQLLKQPQRVNRYSYMKQGIESMSNPDLYVPGFMAAQGGIRLPSMDPDGNHYYVTPDLPFRDLFRLTDPGQLLGQVNPLIKLPYERAAGKQVFNDIPFKSGEQPVPAAYTALPGLMPALSALGVAEKNTDGDWVMHDADLYSLDQMLPPIARVRRMLPSEKRYQERQWTTWMSFAFGLGARSNDESTQISELTRQMFAVQEQLNHQRDLGYITNPQSSIRKAQQPDTTDAEREQILRQLERQLGSAA